MKKHCFLLVVLLGMALGHYSCVNLSVAGGSSSTDNGRVLGVVVDQDGLPKFDAQVMLLPVRYNPLLDPPVPDVSIDTTDETGRYDMEGVRHGDYNLQITQLWSGTSALVRDISVGNATCSVSTAMLQKTGTVEILVLAGAGRTNDFVFIPGTTLSAHAQNGTAVINNVPAGPIPAVWYQNSVDSTDNHIITDSFIVLPSDTTRFTDISPWKFSKKLLLNTTPAGADVLENVFNFPVLVRLTAANFTFSRAKPDGSDLRFTKSNGTPLPFEIERWDAAAQVAEVWVKVDTVYGSDSSHYLTMLWGNPAAVSASSGARVFDTAVGFQGVWHLDQPAAAPATDATANHYDGTPSDTAPLPVDGVMGMAQRFNGSSSCLQMKGTADSRLNFPENGTYTVSAWAYADTLDSLFHTIVAKSDLQYNMELLGDQWQFAEYNETMEWEMTEFKAAAKSWMYIAGVRSGTRQYLYINGSCVDSTINRRPNAKPFQRSTGFDVMIGKTTGLDNTSFPYAFTGRIDELRIENVSRGMHWQKLCFMNQKAENRLVVFK